MSAVDSECMRIRRAHFPDRIVFHAPGLKRYQTSEYNGHRAIEFVAISLTGTRCALNCDHCRTTLLKGMATIEPGTSLFDLCVTLAQRGARGILVTGGSDRQGRVPLDRVIPDLGRIRQELGLAIRVHPGLPDEASCAALAPIGIDGVMLDIIGHPDTIRNVYHLDASPQDYAAALGRLERHGIPTIPHIVLGLHYGQMLGEWNALEMIKRHPPQALVLVILMPLTGTPMAGATPPSLQEIGRFFETARRTLPSTPILLGCARPLGAAKPAIDHLAIDAGLNGIAFPSDGCVAYAREKNLEPDFVNACCGITW